jgi:hypothetical protein
MINNSYSIFLLKKNKLVLSLLINHYSVRQKKKIIIQFIISFWYENLKSVVCLILTSKKLLKNRPLSYLVFSSVSNISKILFNEFEKKFFFYLKLEYNILGHL